MEDFDFKIEHFEQAEKPKKVTKKEMKQIAARQKKQERIYAFINEKVYGLLKRGLTQSEAEQVAIRMAKEKFT